MPIELMKVTAKKLDEINSAKNEVLTDQLNCDFIESTEKGYGIG